MKFLLPRGTIGQLLRFCNKQNRFEFSGKRKKSETYPFTFGTEITGTRRKIVLLPISKKDFGVITAPPGSANNNAV